MANSEKPKNGFISAISRRKFLLGGAAFGSILLGDGFLRQPTALKVRETSLPSMKIPPGKRLRIVQLSDLHLHTFNHYYKQVVEKTNALNPDLIFLTGDYVEQARNLSGVLDFIDQLSAPAGIFAVQGNWEYWALIEGKRLQDKFREKGVRLLINQSASLSWQGLPLSILGIDFPASSGSVQKLARQADPERLNIALSHVPAFQHELLDNKADLILCGHTHGGQIRIPLLQPFHLPRYSGSFVDGLYHVGESGLPLFVTRGIGTSVMPVRLFCPPEISLITLSGA